MFQSQCSACHTIGRGAAVGPDLQGVTDRREPGWLRVHIQSPSLHRQTNDAVAMALLAEYRIPMPDLHLQDNDVDSVLAYLTSTAAAISPGATSFPSLYIPTLVLAALAIAGLTVLGLAAGTKKLEVTR
jgi:protein SCO1